MAAVRGTATSKQEDGREERTRTHVYCLLEVLKKDRRLKMDGAAAVLFGTKSASHDAHLKVNDRNWGGGFNTQRRWEGISSPGSVAELTGAP